LKFFVSINEAKIQKAEGKNRCGFGYLSVKERLNAILLRKNAKPDRKEGLF